MSFWDHFKELRTRLLKALIGLIITTIISFSISEKLIDILTQPIGGISHLQSIEVTENISVYMRVSLLAGFIMAFPYILYQMLAFVMPGLLPKERRWVMAGIPLATFFFICGVLFTYFVMLNNAIPFLVSFMGVTTIPRLSNYISFVNGMLFWIGVCFELPLVAFLLAKLKIITAGLLARQWRIAIVFIAVLAAVITPTTDPVNMGLLMLPLFILYLLSILFAKIARPKGKTTAS